MLDDKDSREYEWIDLNPLPTGTPINRNLCDQLLDEDGFPVPGCYATKPCESSDDL